MQLPFLHQWFSDSTLKALGWTLVHSLWQGLLAAAVAGIIIYCTRRSAARLRYNLLGAVLFLFVITSVITFIILSNNTGVIKESVYTNVSFENTGSDTGNGEMIVNSETGPLHAFITYFNKYADLFVSLWIVFFLLHCTRLLTGFAAVHRLKNYKTSVSPEDWQTRLKQLSRSLSIRQSIRLFESELVKMPVAIGFLKPVILLPLGLLSNLPIDQVETILLHELAHIRRRDYLMNILQRFTEAVFFFNPALLWISSLIRQEREACCDDIVVANTLNKSSYLEALVSFQEYSVADSGYAMGISSKKHYLLNRVKRMLTRENKKLDAMEKIVLIAGVIMLTAFSFIPSQDKVDNKKITKETPLATEELKPSTSPEIPLVAEVRPVPKQYIRKENSAVAVLPATAVVLDTVPAKEMRRTNAEEMSLQSVSSTVNNDGTTKTSVTTVVDQQGKKYMFTKLNDKVTSLSIDGRKIPENEISNYSALIGKIDRAMEKNREERKAYAAKRAEESRIRKEDNKARIAERRVNTERVAEEKVRQREQSGAERKQRVSENERRRKEIERERRTRTKNNVFRRVPNKTYLNGREVIKNDKEQKINLDVQQKIDVASLVQYKQDHKLDLTKEINTDAKYEANNKFDVDLKTIVDLKQTLLKNDVKTKYLKIDIDRKQETPCDTPETPKKPGPPVKPVTKKSKSTQLADPPKPLKRIKPASYPGVTQA
ncbi:MAG TPA: M56 family metallopeptidase [Chitinophagaceae bacterium]